MKICKNYINGEWVESVSGKTAPTYNPANGEILAEVVQSGLEDEIGRASCRERV